MQMHIRVISVGRERANEFTSLAVQDYATRIRRSAELDLVELPAGNGVTSRDREAEGILATHGKTLARGAGELWAVDERRARRPDRTPARHLDGAEPRHRRRRGALAPGHRGGAVPLEPLPLDAP